MKGRQIVLNNRKNLRMQQVVARCSNHYISQNAANTKQYTRFSHTQQTLLDHHRQLASIQVSMGEKRAQQLKKNANTSFTNWRKGSCVYVRWNAVVWNDALETTKQRVQKKKEIGRLESKTSHQLHLVRAKKKAGGSNNGPEAKEKKKGPHGKQDPWGKYKGYREGVDHSSSSYTWIYRLGVYEGFLLMSMHFGSGDLAVIHIVTKAPRLHLLGTWAVCSSSS